MIYHTRQAEADTHIYNATHWSRRGSRKGVSFICRAAAEGRAQRRVVLISPHRVRKTFFAFIFQLSGWALVVPSRALHCMQVPDVKGLQDPSPYPGPPCASISCAHAT